MRHCLWKTCIGLLKKNEETLDEQGAQLKFYMQERLRNQTQILCRKGILDAIAYNL